MFMTAVEKMPLPQVTEEFNPELSSNGGMTRHIKFNNTSNSM